MKIIITKDYDEMSKAAFSIVSDVVKEKPNAVLGLATGSTPIGLYELMALDYRENGTSYRNISTVNLDEYVGLEPQNPASYAYFMNLHLFDRVNINKSNTYLPNGIAADENAECNRYNALLEKYVPDVQVLGIGSNGHIGFNEPGTSFDSETHVVKLTSSTIKDNSRLFASVNDVPRKAFSMGIKNILNSKKIVVMASGENKANAVYEMVNGAVSPECPATALRNHPDVTVIVDSAAGKLLK